MDYPLLALKPGESMKLNGKKLTARELRDGAREDYQAENEDEFPHISLGGFLSGGYHVLGWNAKGEYRNRSFHFIKDARAFLKSSLTA